MSCHAQSSDWRPSKTARATDCPISWNDRRAWARCSRVYRVLACGFPAVPLLFSSIYRLPRSACAWVWFQSDLGMGINLTKCRILRRFSSFFTTSTSRGATSTSHDATSHFATLQKTTSSIRCLGYSHRLHDRNQRLV